MNGFEEKKLIEGLLQSYMSFNAKNIYKKATHQTAIWGWVVKFENLLEVGRLVRFGQFQK